MKVSVLGCGTVGSGICDMLQAADGLERGWVLDLPDKIDAPFKVSDISIIINDADTEVIAEAMGGVSPAYEYAVMAIKAGKHFVTSNKALVAACGPELAALAEEMGVAFLFSAACGGAIPFLHNLAIAAQSDEINRFSGILNGTTNFILDLMQSEGGDYQDALRTAQTLGYAEADPAADVSGMDAARKVMLGCAVAWNMLPDQGMDVMGIESFTGRDAADIARLGLTARLIGSGVKSGDTVAAFVQPTLFRAGPEISVRQNLNLISYNARCAGDITLMGAGAGRYPTASAVLRDITDIAAGARTMMQPTCRRVLAQNTQELFNYYVRCEGAETMWETEEVIAPGRIITRKIAVSDMHAAVRQIKDGGAEVFCAAIDR